MSQHDEIDSDIDRASFNQVQRVEAQVTLRLNVPTLPNFVMSGDHKFDVCELNERELRALGAAWTEALVQHAVTRKKNREQDAKNDLRKLGGRT